MYKPRVLVILKDSGVPLIFSRLILAHLFKLPHRIIILNSCNIDRIHDLLDLTYASEPDFIITNINHLINSIESNKIKKIFLSSQTSMKGILIKNRIIYLNPNCIFNLLNLESPFNEYMYLVKKFASLFNISYHSDEASQCFICPRVDDISLYMGPDELLSLIRILKYIHLHRYNIEGLDLAFIPLSLQRSKKYKPGISLTLGKIKEVKTSTNYNRGVNLKSVFAVIYRYAKLLNLNDISVNIIIHGITHTPMYIERINLLEYIKRKLLLYLNPRMIFYKGSFIELCENDIFEKISNKFERILNLYNHIFNKKYNISFSYNVFVPLGGCLKDAMKYLILLKSKSLNKELQIVIQPHVYLPLAIPITYKLGSTTIWIPGTIHTYSNIWKDLEYGLNNLVKRLCKLHGLISIALHLSDEKVYGNAFNVLKLLFKIKSKISKVKITNVVEAINELRSWYNYLEKAYEKSS